MGAQSRAGAARPRRKAEPSLQGSPGRARQPRGPRRQGSLSPSVRTLVRYTDLSERTVRTALDRLAAEGIIAPCDPAIVAAKIKRADQRPQGWDLAMHLVRDDLDDEDLAALERQFPGLIARVAILRTACGVRQDNPGSGVQLPQQRGATSARTGCSSCTRTVL